MGYDVVVDAKGIVRHIQLKATVAGGKRRPVTVNTGLADKPAGLPHLNELRPRHPGAWQLPFPGCRAAKAPPFNRRQGRAPHQSKRRRVQDAPPRPLLRQAAFSPPESVEALAARLFGPGCSIGAKGHELRT